MPNRITQIPTDADLWESIKLDDERAFSTLFHRYSSRIYSNSYAYVKDREVCEQIVHDIFLTVWTNRKTLQIESFKNYLTSAGRYRVYKSINASKIIPIDYKEDLEVYSKNSVGNSGFDRIAYHDLETELDTYLKHLPKRSQEIFLMSRRQLMSNDEIADQLGISKRSVENQITHALKHLRISLKDITVMLIIAEGINDLVN
ncbi:sigma-70 family RNA polymerase sigma factor [Pedobacter sp. MC2016-24]|uniref:sigma-70 family RNA polymerase sigma factor n=1 Tax=Pedobacter sp. MC2016-24 TaxID=2780090 RepID=UPI0018810AA4|nr:sigma-70 family RNA polymerase sigma factor [Pedobacter sp. MC2016-24]MBE9602876.1 sigma-70 family RNA polymerase sigma factor [Pedobacter sp. MC2016-24]